MKFINMLLQKYNAWKEQRFFKKHGVDSWEQYNLKYDKDFKKSAYLIKEMFHGYNTFIIIPNPKMVADFFGTTIYASDVTDWCKKNCVGKYRVQLMSICKNLVTNEFYYGSDISSEEMIVAFKEKDDAVSFIMLYDGPELKSTKTLDVVSIK